jgi:hypothetical protein
MKLKFFLSVGMLLMVSIALSFSPVDGQEIYNGCRMEGDAKSVSVQDLNRLKNRYSAPAPHDFDRSVTLAAMLAPGSDGNRWTNSKAADIIGYVHDVKVGGVESTNCHAKDPLYRDTHIELVLDPMNAGGPKRLIVEVTPRWRHMMQEKGVDWTTRGLRTALLGRWVKVQGWLFFDSEHKNESENTNPGRARNWRATAWEIHPITSIEVVANPQLR